MDSLGLCIINGHCRGFLGPCVGRVTCTSLPLAKMITLFVAKAIRCAQIIAKSLEKLKPQGMKEKPKKTVESSRLYDYDSAILILPETNIEENLNQ
uniref:Uncharacterized protein n=1 Tax=Oryza sativa subsp. japonica TaxID=39947 RepID=Q6Z6S5_ORYSJ|nr:hypothetical protein [Oryza sativa Japonica Group]